MTDAPDRIWAWPGDQRGWYAACCSDEPTMAFADIPYIRLNLHEAAVAAARAEGMREAFAVAKKIAETSAENDWTDGVAAGWGIAEDIDAAAEASK